MQACRRSIQVLGPGERLKSGVCFFWRNGGSCWWVRLSDFHCRLQRAQVEHFFSTWDRYFSTWDRYFSGWEGYLSLWDGYLSRWDGYLSSWAGRLSGTASDRNDWWHVIAECAFGRRGVDDVGHGKTSESGARSQGPGARDHGPMSPLVKDTCPVAKLFLCTVCGISDRNRGVARKLYTDCSYFEEARRRKGMRGKEYGRRKNFSGVEGEWTSLVHLAGA